MPREDKWDSARLHSAGVYTFPRAAVASKPNGFCRVFTSQDWTGLDWTGLESTLLVAKHPQM